MKQLRLTNANDETYDLPLDFWIDSSPVSLNSNISHRSFAAGGRQLADGFPLTRVITISGNIRADSTAEMETKKREISVAVLEAVKLSIIEDEVSRYIEVSTSNIEIDQEQGGKFQEVNIIFQALNTFWEDETESVDTSILAGDDSFEVDTGDTDFIIFPRIEIEADQSADIPSVKLTNISDGGTSLTYNNENFLDGSTVIIDSDKGTVKLNNGDTIDKLVVPSAFIRLQREVNSFEYEGAACTINVYFRRRYLIV